MAHLSSIVYQPVDQEYPEGHMGEFLRVAVKTAVLLPNHGLEGDRKAGRSPQRQVNILLDSWLAQKQQEGYSIAPGHFGEQLIVSGLTEENIATGTRLQIGNATCLEITMPRTGCQRLEMAQGKKGLAGTSIGFLAKVIAGGEINVGDRVQILPDGLNEE